MDAAYLGGLRHHGRGRLALGAAGGYTLGTSRRRTHLVALVGTVGFVALIAFLATYDYDTDEPGYGAGFGTFAGLNLVGWLLGVAIGSRLRRVWRERNQPPRPWRA